MRMLIFTLLGLFVLFQYNLWIGKNGYMDNKVIQEEISSQKQENKKLTQRNEAIFAEIKDLKEGVSAIEERARVEHKLVKPNEIFYRIVKE